MLRSFLKQQQTFEQYLEDKRNPHKKYIRLSFAVHLQCFKQPRATFEALKSLRQYYPDVPVHLISDGGHDFSGIAKHFHCDYTHANQNVSRPGFRQPFEWIKRLRKTCEMYRTAWIIMMEDDVRVRDRISKNPDAHIAGPSGPEFTAAAKAFLLRKHPGLEINGYNGCGGCIFHRVSFLHAYKKVHEIKELPMEADWRVHKSTDAFLTFMFLNAGYVARRWLDHSEERGQHKGPASAFDHQFKMYYNQPMINLE